MGRSIVKDFFKKPKEKLDGVSQSVEAVDVRNANATNDNNSGNVMEEDVAMDSDEEERRERDDGILNEVRNCSDSVLQFVAASCISKISEEGFRRFLTTHNEDFARSVELLWNERSNNYSTHYFCNGCGKKTAMRRECCGSEPMKFVRCGVRSQLKQIMEYHIEDVMEIRRQLRRGRAQSHNLNAPFFKPVWQQENPDAKHLHLSGVLSVDGVSVPGNTKKLWPISVMLVDLKTVDMQKSSNIILEGIVEGPSNPSTAFWNAIIPFIFSDSEDKVEYIGSYSYQLHLVTLVADQPAKRSVFGMKAHQSPHSCFFCLSDGTFHKLEGRSRCQERGVRLTLEDSKHARYGFGNVQSGILHHMMPYETPLDLLHNLGEGLCEIIMKGINSNELKKEQLVAEMIPPRQNFVPKSELFKTDPLKLEEQLAAVTVPSQLKQVTSNRNGSDKLTNFRLMFFSVALSSDIISAKGRVTIAALALTANRMYTNAEADEIFDLQLCAAANWFLQDANTQYLSCKVHEYLYHLHEANKSFNNVGPISTFCFESSYQFALMGYSSRLTRNFCETACSRVILQNAVTREVTRRAKNPSRRFRQFLSHTKGLVPKQESCRALVTTLDNVDAIFLEGLPLYSVLYTQHGKLESEYANRNTCNDVFFTRDSANIQKCYRFIGSVNDKDEFKILAEPLLEAEPQCQFQSLQRCCDSLKDADFYYASEVIRMLKSYEGIKSCVFSGERCFVPRASFSSLGCYVQNDNEIIVTAINGAVIHN